MRVKTVLFTLAIAMPFVVPAMAQTVNIPRYTVIPVVMQDSIGSATATVGDRFYAACSGAQCAGFPSGTRFMGVVTSVTRKSGRTPGQIDVNFTQAILPNGQRVDINGTLTSLNSNVVRVDPQTGLLVGTAGSRDQRNKFIGYGAGGGLIIGALTGNTLTGGLIGAAAGWLLGATVGRERDAKEAVVPAGTQFGIMLQNPVTFSRATTGAGPGAPRPYPRPYPRTPPVETGPQELSIRLLNLQPYRTVGGVLMVPFKATMDALDQEYTYNRSARSVTTTTSRGTITHIMGTNFITLDGNRMMLPTRSRITNGNLYVPSNVFSIATGLSNATWDPSTNTLTFR